jgi:hypothetical protein
MSGFVRLLVPVAALGLGAAVVALPGGCKKSSPPEPATVRGSVTFRGRPLAGGLVVFSPDPDRGGSGKPARGDIDPDGRFELRLGDTSTIPPGWYRVAIAPAADASAFDRAVFPPQLARPDLSGVVREVKAGQANVFDFAVEVPNG